MACRLEQRGIPALEDDLDDLELSVALRCHIRVEVTGGDFTNLALQVLDADDNTMSITSFTAQGSMSQHLKNLVAGKMEVSAVSEDARTAVLVRRGLAGKHEELARRALTLVPGEVCEVHFST